MITPTPPKSPSAMQIPYRRRRSLLGDTALLVMQPAIFYKALPTHYRWALPALLIILITVINEVQTQSVAAPLATVDTWAAGLVAMARLVLVWLLQAVLLSLVTMLKGTRPNLGLNWRLVVWASLPLGLLALVQVLYRSGGGTLGAPGLAGFMDSLPFAAGAPMFAQQLLRSLLSQMTLFWFWHLALLYVGARHALKGNAWAALFVLLMWVVMIVLWPVVTNRV